MQCCPSGAAQSCEGWPAHLAVVSPFLQPHLRNSQPAPVCQHTMDVCIIVNSTMKKCAASDVSMPCWFAGQTACADASTAGHCRQKQQLLPVQQSHAAGFVHLGTSANACVLTRLFFWVSQQLEHPQTYADCSGSMPLVQICMQTRMGQQIRGASRNQNPFQFT